MNRYKKLLACLAIVATAVALAGCQTELPQSTDYKFELVGIPTVIDHRTTISLRLVHMDEVPVVPSQMYVEYWVYNGPKNAPNHVERQELETSAQGYFVYSSNNLHGGGTVHLVARVTPDSTPIHGSVTLP